MIAAPVVAYREGDKSLVMPEDMAGHADLAAAADTKHRLVQQGPVFDCIGA